MTHPDPSCARYSFFQCFFQESGPLAIWMWPKMLQTSELESQEVSLPTNGWKMAEESSIHRSNLIKNCGKQKCPHITLRESISACYCLVSVTVALGPLRFSWGHGAGPGSHWQLHQVLEWIFMLTYRKDPESVSCEYHIFERKRELSASRPKAFLFFNVRFQWFNRNYSIWFVCLCLAQASPIQILNAPLWFRNWTIENFSPADIQMLASFSNTEWRQRVQCMILMLLQLPSVPVKLLIGQELSLAVSTSVERAWWLGASTIQGSADVEGHFCWSWECNTNHM